MHEKIKEATKAARTAAAEHMRAKFKLLAAKGLYTPYLEFEVQRRLGTVHHFMGHHEKAIRQLVMAAGLASALEIADAVVAELYFYLGDSFFWLDRHTEMMAISSVGLSKLKKGSCFETMLLYENLRRAKRDSAEKYARINQELIKEANYFPNIDRVYHGIAWTLGLVKGDLDYSLSMLLDGLKLCEENDYEVGICRSYHSIADILKTKVELKEAIAYYKRAIEIAEQIGYEDMLTYSYVDIGEAIMKEGNLALAEGYLSLGAERACNAGNGSYAAAAYDRLVKIYRSTGNTVGLVGALTEFAKHGREAYPRASIQAFLELSTIYLDKEHFKADKKNEH